MYVNMTRDSHFIMHMFGLFDIPFAGFDLAYFCSNWRLNVCMVMGVVDGRVIDCHLSLNATTKACYIIFTPAIYTYSLRTFLTFWPFPLSVLSWHKINYVHNDGRCNWSCFQLSFIFDCYNLSMLYNIHASDLYLFIVHVHGLFENPFASFNLAHLFLKIKYMHDEGCCP